MKFDVVLQVRVRGEVKTWLRRAAAKRGRGHTASEIARDILQAAFEARHAK